MSDTEDLGNSEAPRGGGLAAVLGLPGQPIAPMTVYGARAVELAAQILFDAPGAPAYQWFEQWDCTPPEERKVIDIAMGFVGAGWQRTAWLLEHLHYDQTLKHSMLDQKGENLGHPLYGIAQVAMATGHMSVARHYASLATIGDVIFWGPNFRGAAPHSLANLSDWGSFEQLHAQAVERVAKFARGTPLFPEALLAAHWLPAARSEYVLRLATATTDGSLPFVDRLLNAAAQSSNTTEAGTLFEAAAALLLSSTAGFEVRGAREDVSSQTDMLLLYQREQVSRPFLPEGHAIVECKHRTKPVDAPMVREFGARCDLRKVPLGILVAKNSITGADSVDHALRDAERERRDYLSKGVHILVLSADELRGMSRDLRGLESLLLQDYEHLRFGRRS